MAATPPKAPDPATSPWLHIAAPVGKIATLFLLVSNFLLLFAPLFFLVDFSSYADPGTRSGSLIMLFADPVRLLAIGNYVAIVGIAILASAMFLILLGLLRADKRPRIEILLLGFASLGCLVTWVPVMVNAQARVQGTAASVDAVAATGGMGLASGLLLAASLAYLFFTIRLENGAKPRRLRTFWWPIYGAMNVLGSAVLAGFFQGASLGSGNLDAFILALTLKVTLIPLLGVVAYRDLRDRFPWWAHVPLVEAPGIPKSAPPKPVPSTARFARPAVAAYPLPPPPDD